MNTTIEFTNLEALQSEFVKVVADTYKKNLKRDKKSASGNLIKSIKPDKNQLHLADYWKFVEYGRKPGKFPPKKSIQDFVKSKHINFPGDVFLISRSIARNGIKSGHQLEDAIDTTTRNFNQKIEDALQLDLEKILNQFTL